jgi:ribonuclease HII
VRGRFLFILLLHNEGVKKASKKVKYIIGIDEVGRGPLAGPVAVGAVALTPKMLRKFRTIKESKQLSEAKREEWTSIIKKEVSPELRIAVKMVSAKEIDRIGIAPAIRCALAAALKKLSIDPNDCEVLLDGGLRAPSEYKKQKTIIRGDASETVIAMASVVAKVKRDRLMVRYAKEYPLYGFAQHKGYGTAAHMKALKKHGLSELHRKTFCSFLKA